MPDAASWRGRSVPHASALKILMFSDANQKIDRRFHAGGLGSYWNDVLSP